MPDYFWQQNRGSGVGRQPAVRGQVRREPLGILRVLGKARKKAMTLDHRISRLRNLVPRLQFPRYVVFLKFPVVLESPRMRCPQASPLLHNFCIKLWASSLEKLWQLIKIIAGENSWLSLRSPVRKEYFRIMKKNGLKQIALTAGCSCSTVSRVFP